jgi:hypothetical protein
MTTPLFPLAWSPLSAFEVLDEIKDLDDLARLLWNLGARLHNEDPKELEARRLERARLGFGGVLEDLERDGEAAVAAELRADLDKGDKGRAVPALWGEIDAFLERVQEDRPEPLTSFVFAYGASLWLQRHAKAGHVFGTLPDGREIKAQGPFEWADGAEAMMDAYLEGLRTAARGLVSLEGADLWWLDAVMVRHLGEHECTDDGRSKWFDVARTATLPLGGRVPTSEGLWAFDPFKGSSALRVLGRAAWAKGLGLETSQAIERRKTPAIRHKHAQAITGANPQGFSETAYLAAQGYAGGLADVLAKWAANYQRPTINTALAFEILNHAARKAAALREVPGEVATLHRYDTWEDYYREIKDHGPLWSGSVPGTFRADARAIILALAEIGKQTVNEHFEKTAQALAVAEFEFDTATGRNTSGGRRIARGGALRITWGAWVVAQEVEPSSTKGMLVPILAQSLPLASVHTKLRAAYGRMELVVLTELTERRESAFDGDGRLLGVPLDLADLAKTVWGDARAPSVAKTREALEHLQAVGRFELVDAASGRWWVHEAQTGARALLKQGAWLQREGRKRGLWSQELKRARIAGKRGKVQPG